MLFFYYYYYTSLFFFLFKTISILLHYTIIFLGNIYRGGGSLLFLFYVRSKVLHIYTTFIYFVFQYTYWVNSEINILYVYWRYIYRSMRSILYIYIYIYVHNFCIYASLIKRSIIISTLLPCCFIRYIRPLFVNYSVHLLFLFYRRMVSEINLFLMKLYFYCFLFSYIIK